MSDLDRFELFTLVAHLGSLTRAASELGVTKALLSRQLKQLETNLQVDLFSRKKQRLQLTADGELLLTQCIRLKKELDDTRAICQAFHQEPEGILHVVALEFFAKSLIFPRLKQFTETYPKLELFIDLAERIPDFEREQVDLAFGFSLPVAPDIIQRRMLSTRYVMVASPRYFAEHGKPEKLIDLVQHRYIGHKARNEVRDMNLKAGNTLQLQPYIVLNNVAAMIECAKQGLGIIQLPLYLLNESLEAGVLEEILTPYQADTANVYYYYPKFRYTQPKVRKFIDFFCESNGVL